MQTFVPLGDVRGCACVLDNRRLNKQITECKQIARVLRGESVGWRNHPATRMWGGCEQFLAYYAMCCYIEWITRWVIGRRGGKHTHAAGDWFRQEYDFEEGIRPEWWGGVIHASHRAALLFKDNEWYQQWGWKEEPKLNYVWPV